ncbi:3'-5' exonuclease domain [Macleaya cordata]|uniref:3'-5' exonuclease domain n=1 Tax=Macleaya cordata TaxID=56857 RepID=A0A200R229_MACCD|nr:3'-5' exonuclease domain [Macleaya cordata]
MTTASIEDLNCSANTHQTYTVTFHEDQINTVVTQTASIVDDWVSNIHRDFNRILNNLVVGFDIEWRPTFNRNQENKAALLQLCVGHRCLIFQFLYADHIPRSLIEFLNNPNFTFVGVGIDEDVEKLLYDHELGVANTLDLRHLAVQKLNKNELSKAGLKGLTEAVLGLELKKPKKVTMSRWDVEYLTYDQIMYACLDAFVAFKMGKNLMSL